MEISHHGLTRDDVIFGYRYLLNREPESEQAIRDQMTFHPNLASFRAGLLNCAEFQNGMGAELPPSYVATVNRGYWASSSKIDYRVSVELENRLTERTRRQWVKLGEQEPYWSVLTHSHFRMEHLDDKSIAEFRETGRQSADLIDLMVSKGGVAATSGACVELGCGVGRITRHLANRFEKVIAVDISPGNLALCRRYLDEERVDNVQTLLITEAEDLAALPPFDFLYSVIVLQHNTPPIQYKMLDLLFSRISPGGVCLFQAVADMPGYEFDAESYLITEEPVMEVTACQWPVSCR